jgi:hypothetical protein
MGAVATVVFGWGVAQWPYLLPTSLKVEAAAAPDATLISVVVVFLLAAVICLPSLGLLYVLDQKSLLDRTNERSRTCVAQRGQRPDPDASSVSGRGSAWPRIGHGPPASASLLPASPPASVPGASAPGGSVVGGPAATWAAACSAARRGAPAIRLTNTAMTVTR